MVRSVLHSVSKLWLFYMDGGEILSITAYSKMFKYIKINLHYFNHVINIKAILWDERLHPRCHQHDHSVTTAQLMIDHAIGKLGGLSITFICSCIYPTVRNKISGRLAVMGCKSSTPLNCASHSLWICEIKAKSQNEDCVTMILFDMN